MNQTSSKLKYNFLNKDRGHVSFFTTSFRQCCPQDNMNCAILGFLMVCRYQLRREVSPEISQVTDTIYTKHRCNWLFPKGVEVWLLYPAFDVHMMSENIITSKLEARTQIQCTLAKV